MSTDSHIKLIDDWVTQVWNAADLDATARFHPSTFQNEGQSSTPAQAREWHEHIRATYPDLRYTIDDIFAAGDRVAMRWTATGTHRGYLWGLVPPTGKQITWRGFHMLRIENDQIVQVWALADTAAQLQQMGVQLQPTIKDDNDI